MKPQALAMTTLAALLLSGLAAADEAEKKVKANKLLTDRDGDPLPAGASARLGTLRFRHPFWVSGLAYSPDGKILASSCWDGGVHLWDAATGKKLRVYRPQPIPRSGDMALMGVAISAKGKLVGIENHDIAHVWDLDSGKELWQLKGGNGFGLALSQDGKTLVKALGGGEKKQLALWDLDTGQLIRELGAISRHVNAVAFAPNGKIIAAGDGPPQLAKDQRKTPCTLRIWDPTAGLELRELQGHEGGITSVAYSPDGKMLASASHDGTIRFWVSVSGQLLRTIKVPEDFSPDDDKAGPIDRKKGVHYGGIGAIAFSRDGRLLASGGYDGTVRTWDPSTGKELNAMHGHGREVVALAFSPDDKTLASGGFDHAIHLWDPRTGKELQPREGFGGPVHALAVSPDGQLVAATSGDRTIRLWSLATEKQLQVLRGHTDYVFSATFSANSRIVASASEDHTVRIWDVATGRELHKLVGHAGAVYAVAFFPTGKMLASAGSDGTIRVWDWSAAKELRQIRGPNSYYLYISPDGRILGADGETARLWDTATGKEIRQIGDSSAHFALTPDGRSCVTEDRTGMIHLLNVDTGQKLRSVAVPDHSAGTVGQPPLLLSPDGRLLARSSGSVIKLWEIATGRVRRQFTGHGSYIHPLAFGPDGRTLVSGGDDTTILIWDVSRGYESPRSRLNVSGLKTLWDDLGADDAERADRAIHSLVARPVECISFLNENLRPVAIAKAQHIARLIDDLGSNQFAIRQKATVELARLDEQADSALRTSLGQGLSLETQRRIEQLLAKLRSPITSPEYLRLYRVVEVLETIGTVEAKEVLQRLANGAPQARNTQEAKAALHRLERQSSSAGGNVP